MKLGQFLFTFNAKKIIFDFFDYEEHMTNRSWLWNFDQNL